MKILAMNADENQWRFWIKIHYKIHKDISDEHRWELMKILNKD